MNWELLRKRDRLLQNHNGLLLPVTFVGVTKYRNLVQIEDDKGVPRLVSKFSLRPANAKRSGVKV